MSCQPSEQNQMSNIEDRLKIIDCYTSHNKAYNSNNFAKAFQYRDSIYRNSFKHTFELFKTYDKLPDIGMTQMDCLLMNRSVIQLSKAQRDTMSFESFLNFYFNGERKLNKFYEYSFLREIEFIDTSHARAYLIRENKRTLDFIKEDDEWKIQFSISNQKASTDCNTILNKRNVSRLLGYYASRPYMNLKNINKRYSQFNEVFEYKSLVFPSFDHLGKVNSLFPTSHIKALAISDASGGSKYENDQLSILSSFNNLDYLYIGSNIKSKSDQDITLLKEISKLVNLTHLNIQAPTLDLPIEFEQLKNLETLKIRLIGDNIPEVIFKLQKLKELVITGYQISAIPPQISNLTNLEKLNLVLQQGDTLSLPSGFKKLNKLKDFTVSIKVDSLHTFLPDLPNIEYLELYNPDINKISNFLPSIISFRISDPLSIDGLENLKTLEHLLINSYNNKLVFKPELDQLENLKTITVYNQKMTNIPSFISSLSKLEYLEISSSNIEELELNCNRLKNLALVKIDGKYRSSYPFKLCNAMLIIKDDASSTELFNSYQSIWHSIWYSRVENIALEMRDILIENTELLELSKTKTNFDEQLNYAFAYDFERFLDVLQKKFEIEFKNESELLISYEKAVKRREQIFYELKVIFDDMEKEYGPLHLKPTQLDLDRNRN